MATYDSNEVSVNFAGIPVDPGAGAGEYAADGDFVSIEFDEPAFKDVKSIDGKMTRSKTNDRSATMKIRLMDSSPTNALFSTLHRLDMALPNGAGVGTFSVRDRNGLSLHFSDKAWISAPPNVAYGQLAQVREWTFRCEYMDSFDGGR